jgi:hypothetical protein
MTATLATNRPEAGEYDPYYDRYISLLPAFDIIGILRSQIGDTIRLFSPIGEGHAAFRYAPGKWSIRELLGHVIDTERIMAYRALRIARNDKTPMEGFEQDDYVRDGPFEQCKLKDLIDEFSLVRQTTLAMLGKLQPEAWTRRGVANNNDISVRALAYIIAGHELHHQKILQDKYLAAMNRS